MTGLNYETYTYYAANTGLAALGGFYIGMQRGASPMGVPATSSVTFSVFAGGAANTFRNLDPSRCIYGADRGHGISCAVAFPWTPGTSCRVSTDIVLSADPVLCPAATPTVCLVYNGYIGLVSQPFTRSLISRWSLNLTVYGDSTYTDYFVETFAPSGYCQSKPHGYFVYPHYAINGGSYYSPSVSSHDVNGGSTAFPNCGRSYLASWSSSYQWIV